MDGLTFLSMMFFCVIAFILMAFAIFAIGFLVGYRVEDRKIKSKRNYTEIKDDNIKIEKVRKDWKSFLEYDGSTPYDTI